MCISDFISILTGPVTYYLDFTDGYVHFVKSRDLSETNEDSHYLESES